MTPDDVDDVTTIALTIRSFSAFKQEIEDYFGTDGEL